MNAPAPSPTAIPETLGAPMPGGWLAGRIRNGADRYALILPPKAERTLVKRAPWNKSLGRVDGALSFCDGLANTRAMADAGSDIAITALEKDLYIPARDELECLYRLFKPTTRENFVYRAGDNPSSRPTGYPYTRDAPAQTQMPEFQAGGPEAFDADWYWSSTQYASYGACAWLQDFEYGNQGDVHKSNSYGVVLVRRVAIR